MESTKEQHQILYKSQKTWTDTLEVIRQATEEESMRHTRVFERHVQTHRDPKRRDK
jgi:hypothetical protein